MIDDSDDARSPTPYVAVTFLLCPLCKLVVGRVPHRSSSPTSDTQLAPTPCARCDLTPQDPDYPARGRLSD
jgi:hypothetical protein